MCMPPGKDVIYSEARSGHWPPYMIDFRDSIGERHAENLKVRLMPGFTYA